MNEKNRFFVEHLWFIMSGCILAISSGYVLQQDDIVWAVFMVKSLVIIYCIIWSVIMWKMLRVVIEEDVSDLMTERT